MFDIYVPVSENIPAKMQLKESPLGLTSRLKSNDLYNKLK